MKCRIPNSGGGNMNAMLKQAQKMQEDMQNTQEEVAAQDFEATAGGGAITVIISGDKKIKSIKIKPEVVDPEDVEMLQDLIITCINEAMRKADDATTQAMGKFNIPGGLF